MLINSCVEKAKVVTKHMMSGKREAILQSIGELANSLQATMNDENVWSSDELRQFNALMKYILLAVENGDYEFGIHVINNNLLYLLKAVAGRHHYEDQPSIESKIDNTTQKIKDQYTDFMYPNHWQGELPPNLKQELDGTHATAVYNLTYIQHMAAQKFRPVEKLDVLVAGCGTGEWALCCAAFHPQTKFTLTDISPASLQLAEKYARELGLKNVSIVQDDIMTMDLGEQFDIIISVGVIHHLSDPSMGIANLKNHLKDSGILAAMVYGKYGRFEIALFQEALKIVIENKVDFNKGIDIAKLFFDEINIENRMVNILWKEDVSKGDQHIVDLLLNVNEHKYSVRTLNDMVSAAGMKVVDFSNNHTLDPFTYLKPETAKRITANLTYMEKCQLAELINGKISKHTFFAINQENDYRKLSLDDSGSMNYVLYKSPFIIQKTIIENGRKRQMITLNYSSLHEDIFGLDVEIDDSLNSFLDLCDGKNSVAQIYSKLKGKIDIKKVRLFIRDMLEKRVLFLHE